MLFRRFARLPFDREYFMALFSGFEGGLATTSAIAAGLLIFTQDTSIVITTATISYIVQAFNGAIGKFSAEHTNDEIDHEDILHGYKKPIINASLQFTAHAVMGAIVLLPIIYIDDTAKAMLFSIGITLTLLFLLGAYKGYVVGKSSLADAVEQVGLGVLVICAGIVAGYLLG
jgi:VIT1/CCC1 family predicted Fe2+/Mn2+ transporter